MTVSLDVWSTERRNSSRKSWCRHWRFPRRYIFTSFPSSLHSRVVPSAGFCFLLSAVITHGGGLNTCQAMVLHNLEIYNLHDQTTGNMFCTMWKQKRDRCFSSLCGKREGVRSVVSGIVEVPTHAILLLIARCSLEWIHHPGNVLWFRNGTQLPWMKGLYLKGPVLLWISHLWTVNLWEIGRDSFNKGDVIVWPQNTWGCGVVLTLQGLQRQKIMEVISHM